MKPVKAVLLALASALIAALMLVPAAQASERAPGYEAFAGCPDPEESPDVGACLSSEIYGGHFKMGNKDVPITNPMTLSGGLNGKTGEIEFNSQGGLTRAKQKVPGGVVGLTGLTWLLEVLGSEALTLYAVTELAGSPYLTQENGATYQLPVKVHLVNPVLGNNCYIGSNSSPIHLNLTTGTTSPPPPAEPISGSKGEVTYEPTLKIVHENDMRLVDNSFAAPGANGCTLTLFGFIPIGINGLVNTQSGLPAAAGTNETIQEVNAQLVNSAYVFP